ncbi:phage holin [Carnobacterium sp. ISL-102]|uniref:phage holin n=1 Tax=Carnobacterium sp. ISL-102 TaxID=2819142 RepID=UPI001BE88345|nr:phage holin [Carnobacterium sp. ISL-102]MBT2732129.1 hypothetical protein [Carnobacterium sp. ISL-102]
MNKLNIKGIPTGTWVRLIGLFVILANQVSVSIFNFQLVPYPDESIYEGVSTILTILISVFATWKDTPVTIAAQEGNKVTNELKEEDK